METFINPSIDAHQNLIKEIYKQQSILSDIAFDLEAQSQQTSSSSSSSDQQLQQSQQSDRRSNVSVPDIGQMEEAFKKYVVMESQCAAHIDALKELKQTIRSMGTAGTLDQADFEELYLQMVQTRIKTFTEDDYRQNQHYLNFKRRIWAIHHPDEPLPWEKDEDIVESSQSTTSLLCPISRQMMVHPVKNRKCNHVYELDNIRNLMTNHFKSRHNRRAGHQRPCPCPVAACQATVSEADLEPDLFVSALLEQARRSGASAIGGADGGGSSIARVGQASSSARGQSSFDIDNDDDDEGHDIDDIKDLNILHQ